MSEQAARAAERLLLRAAGANPRQAVPGSVVLDGFALDWTERIKRNGDFYARCGVVTGQDVLEILAADLAAASPTPAEGETT